MLSHKQRPTTNILLVYVSSCSIKVQSKGESSLYHLKQSLTISASLLHVAHTQKTMPNGFCNLSQNPKKNRYHYRDPSPKLPMSSSLQLCPNSNAKEPLLAQERYQRKGKDNIKWGLDPWAASHTVTIEAEEIFKEDVRRSGVSCTYNPNTIHAISNPNPQQQHQLSPSQQNISRISVKQRQSYQQYCTNRSRVLRTYDPNTIYAKSNPQQQHHPSPSQHKSSRVSVKQRQSHQQYRADRSRPIQQQTIIPGVSQMTMRQILSVIYSAFWDRADLYTDVLSLDNDQVNARQLKLAYLRQGRVVLAKLIKFRDDLTILSAEIRGMKIGTEDGDEGVSTAKASIADSETPVIRKMQLKFQAISLAYELLKDEDRRKTYDKWKLWTQFSVTDR